MKHFYLILFIFLSANSYAQEKEPVKPQRTPSPLQGEVVPEDKRSTSTETTPVDLNGQTRFYVLSRESQQTVELTKEDKLAEIDRTIQSVEGKLFELNGDPVGNQVEIGEKLQYLQELQAEKEALKNL